MENRNINKDRRLKGRFPIRCAVRYKVLDQKRDCMAAFGNGETLNVGSGGVAFNAHDALTPGCFIELSISWPVPLYDGCAMRLVIYGRVLRGGPESAACTVERYEFRTQARQPVAVPAERQNPNFLRWVDLYRKESSKVRAYSA